MSGIPKKGIDYAGWNSHIFDGDNKIDKLLDAQGWDGFAVYFFLCQKAYATEGYFYRWSYDDAATTARRMAGGIRSETVKAAVGTCTRVGLFDKRLLDDEGILTSRGIQRRFVAAIQKRSYRAVNIRYWLLDEAETAAGKIVFEKMVSTDVGDSYAANTHVLPEDAYVLPEDTPKSKVNKSKDIIHTRARGEAEEADDGFTRFWDAYPKRSGDIRGAYMEYLRALDSGAVLADLLSALEWQRLQPGWLERGGQFIPSPEKWLRNRSWLQQKPKQTFSPKRNGMPVVSEPDPQAEAAKLELMKRIHSHLAGGNTKNEEPKQ